MIDNLFFAYLFPVQLVRPAKVKQLRVNVIVLHPPPFQQYPLHPDVLRVEHEHPCPFIDVHPSLVLRHHLAVVAVLPIHYEIHIDPLTPLLLMEYLPLMAKLGLLN